jgi:hypothetical protein
MAIMRQYQLLLSGGHLAVVLSKYMKLVDFWQDIRKLKQENDMAYFLTLQRTGVDLSDFIVDAKDIIGVDNVNQDVIDTDVLEKKKQILEENLRKKEKR